MHSVAMDAGKYRTYGIVDKGGVIVKEGYAATNREKFEEFFQDIDHATVIVEASTTIDRIVSVLPQHEIKVANPYKVR